MVLHDASKADSILTMWDVKQKSFDTSIEFRQDSILTMWDVKTVSDEGIQIDELILY